MGWGRAVAEQREQTTPANEILESFSALWERYHRSLTWFVSGYLSELRNGDRAHQVEDAVQEIMLKVYRSRERYDGRRAVSTWIYAIARNHCIDLVRRTGTRRVRLARDVDPDLLSSPERNGPESQLVRAELHAAVGRFIASLAGDDRTMLMLRFYEDLPYAQIALATGRPEGTVKYRIHELKKQLRLYLEAEDEHTRP